MNKIYDNINFKKCSFWLRVDNIYLSSIEVSFLQDFIF